MYRHGEATLESNRASIRFTDGASGPCQEQATRNLSGPIQSGEEPIPCRATPGRPDLEFLLTIQSLPTSFVDRHIGAHRQADVDTMLKAVGYDSVEGLVDVAVPSSIRQESALRLQDALSEVEVLAELRRLAAKNKTAVQMIGQGYYDTVTPPVIRRNILNPPPGIPPTPLTSRKSRRAGSRRC